MVSAMYITNYWLTLHLNGKRVVVAPDAELPAGVPEAEIRALLDAGAIRQADAGAIRQADAGAMNRAPTDNAAPAQKPRKTKTEKQP